MPSKVKNIMHSFITDTHDLYIAVESKEEANGSNIFEIYFIDLDLPYPTVEGPLFQYPWDAVNSFNCDSSMIAFHCRSSSKKEKINLNEILICYMLHGPNLYMWADDGKNRGLELVNDGCGIHSRESYPASNLVYISNRKFLYMETRE